MSRKHNVNRKFLNRLIGAKEGVCNICGVYGPLTNDHVPPKSSIKINQMMLNHAADFHSGGNSRLGKLVMQNGVTFRTICGQCNNDVLGAKLDSDFGKFIDEIRAYIRNQRFITSDYLGVKIAPQKIMRAVIGHMAAIGADHPVSEDVREYLLDEDKPLPKNIRFYFWLFPYRNAVHIRDMVYSDTRLEGGGAVSWILKFTPIAFWVVFDQPNQLQLNYLNELTRFGTNDFDSEVEYSMAIRPTLHFNFPEIPNPDSPKTSLALHGANSFIAREYVNQSKKNVR